MQYLTHRNVKTTRVVQEQGFVEWNQDVVIRDGQVLDSDIVQAKKGDVIALVCSFRGVKNAHAGFWQVTYAHSNGLFMYPIDGDDAVKLLVQGKVQRELH